MENIYMDAYYGNKTAESMCRIAENVIKGQLSHELQRKLL